jgi:hypothetical protein
METRPWSECLPLAAALCWRHGDFIKAIKLLWLRGSPAARKRYWARAWARPRRGLRKSAILAFLPDTAELFPFFTPDKP